MIRMITVPHISWRKLSSHQNHEAFLNRYLYPIFGVITLTSFVGGLWMESNRDVQVALKGTIISLVTVYAGYYIASYVLNELLPRFGIAKDQTRVQHFVGYSSALIYALFIVLPFLSDFLVLWLFALYTAYIVYTGYGIFIVGKEEARMSFTGTATAIILLTPALIHLLLSIIIN